MRFPEPPRRYFLVMDHDKEVGRLDVTDCPWCSGYEQKGLCSGHAIEAERIRRAARGGVPRTSL